VRAVLDPNVLISGLISSSGGPALVLAAVDTGRVEIVISPLLVEELERALAYPRLRKRIGEDDADRALAWLRMVARTVDDPPDAPPVRSDDPGDDYLIVLAASVRAALVSGDQHLLALKRRIPVYSPSEFMQLLDSSGG
jgi:putative PIN family toxin of toxin-antitoxin system